MSRWGIRRYTPVVAMVFPDLLIVDTRSAVDRARDGVIPGAEHLPLSVLPWRADDLAGRRICLVCAHGLSSSLAAALLVELGVDAGDVIGGYEAW